ncbi:MAG: hypothetical protein IPJ26_10900 [Bacteroidetes bacterium]|nr:hypothetical protein [Bacteroidota bacterium]
MLQKSWNPDGELSFLHLDSTIDIRIEKNIEQREIIDLSFNRRINELNPMDDPMVDQNSALEERKIALVEKRMKTKMKKLNSIMQKLTFQIVDPQGNIFNRISKRNLDSIVMAEIKNHDLELDYKYGVFQKNIPKALLLTNKDDSLSLINSPYQLSLFPNDIINKSEVLCLDFNNKFNYILSSMFLMLLFSLLFTGIIITGFGYTLFVIQQQKKLAIIKNDFINNMTHEFKTPYCNHCHRQ